MKQEKVWRSDCPNTAPGNPQKPRKPSLRDFTPEERIALGRRLLAVKEQLPHGLFWPWVREKSGLKDNTVKASMKTAIEAQDGGERQGQYVGLSQCQSLRDYMIASKGPHD